MSRVQIYNHGKRHIQFSDDGNLRVLAPNCGTTVSGSAAAKLIRLFPGEVKDMKSMIIDAPALVLPNGKPLKEAKPAKEAAAKAEKKETVSNEEAQKLVDSGKVEIPEKAVEEKPLELRTAAELKVIATKMGLEFNPRANAPQMLALITEAKEAAAKAEGSEDSAEGENGEE